MAKSIDDSDNKPVLAGTDKIPIGDGTGDPLHYTPNQIKEHVEDTLVADGGSA